MKRGFTLLEVMISITIFLIVLTAMYKVLDSSKVSISKMDEHISKGQVDKELYNILIEDIAESKKVILTFNQDQQSIITFQSNNSFYNPFYMYKTYLVSSSNKLMRIESLNEFKKEKLNDQFFSNAFIDVLVEDIEKFYVVKKENQYLVIIKQKNKEKLTYSTYQMVKE